MSHFDPRSRIFRAAGTHRVIGVTRADAWTFGVEVNGGVRLVSEVRFPGNFDTDAIHDAVDWTDLGRRIRVAADDAVELVATAGTHVRGGASAMRSGGQAESNER